MSRSRKKVPVIGICSTEGMADYKRQRAGAERARERELLRKAVLGSEEAESTLEVEQVRWNEWDTPRDGKCWWDDYPKAWRK